MRNVCNPWYTLNCTVCVCVGHFIYGVRCLISIQFAVQGHHLDVVHHLQVEVIFGALQNESAAHIGCRIVEVKDDIIGIRASFGPKYPVDLLGSLHLIGQVVSSWGTSKHTQIITFG